MPYRSIHLHLHKKANNQALQKGHFFYHHRSHTNNVLIEILHQQEENLSQMIDKYNKVVHFDFQEGYQKYYLDINWHLSLHTHHHSQYLLAKRDDLHLWLDHIIQIYIYLNLEIFHCEKFLKYFPMQNDPH